MTNDVNDGNFAASVKSDEWDMLYNLINSRFVSFINTHPKKRGCGLKPQRHQENKHEMHRKRRFR